MQQAQAWLVGALMLLGLSGSLQVQAQPPETVDREGPEDQTAVDQATARFTAGMAHFDEREFREAIREFELAAQLVPSADLWFNIARAHEELNEYGEAAEYYGKYLRDRVDPPDREQVEERVRQLEAQAEAARLARRRRPTTGVLRIQSSEAGADVILDDQPIGTTPMGLPLTVEPGIHRISVLREGFVPFESAVQITPGVTTAAYADLQPATAYRSIRGNRIFTWIVGGLSVASLVPATIFALQASSENADGSFSDAQNSARLADVFFGGSLVLGVGSVLLYFLEGRSVGTERMSGPAQAGNGLGDGIRF